jgi:DNA-directed RNA polymerase subunit RPC12/RpoP
MADFIFYQCNKCGHKFESRECGEFYLTQYRCVKCDAIKRVKSKRPIKEAGRCKKCGGKLQKDFRMTCPLCPKCKSENVVEISKLTID